MTTYRWRNYTNIIKIDCTYLSPNTTPYHTQHAYQTIYRDVIYSSYASQVILIFANKLLPSS